jgi:hypothetical protein
LPLEQLRESCCYKLEDFLGAETRSVVDSIFDFLQTGEQTEVEADRGTIRAGGVMESRPEKRRKVYLPASVKRCGDCLVVKNLFANFFKKQRYLGSGVCMECWIEAQKAKAAIFSKLKVATAPVPVCGVCGDPVSTDKCDCTQCPKCSEWIGIFGFRNGVDVCVTSEDRQIDEIASCRGCLEADVAIQRLQKTRDMLTDELGNAETAYAKALDAKRAQLWTLRTRATEAESNLTTAHSEVRSVEERMDVVENHNAELLVEVDSMGSKIQQQDQHIKERELELSLVSTERTNMHAHIRVHPSTRHAHTHTHKQTSTYTHTYIHTHTHTHTHTRTHTHTHTHTHTARANSNYLTHMQKSQALEESKTTSQKQLREIKNLALKARGVSEREVQTAQSELKEAQEKLKHEREGQKDLQDQQLENQKTIATLCRKLEVPAHIYL